MAKRQLRNLLLTSLKKQTKQQREYKSKSIERKLLKQEEFIKAKKIMFYLAFDGEVKTKDMINKAREFGKEIYIPLCDTKRRILRPCFLSKDSKLKKGPYQALEPEVKVNLSFKKLDLVIVPALAFDKSGNRLGRGKGYYDRFLKKIISRIDTIGLAFDFQILPALPVEHTDIPVDKVLSA